MSIPPPPHVPGEPMGQPPVPPQPYHQPPQYGAQPALFAPQPYAQHPPTNTLAIVAFAGSFIVGLVGIICGHLALAQIRRTGEKGHGFALAGTIIGYCSVALNAVIGMIVVVVLVSAAQSGAQSGISAAPAASDDCATVVTAGRPLSTALTNAEKTFEDEPRDAGFALDRAVIDFEANTADITDNMLKDHVETLVDDVVTLSHQLDAYGRGEFTDSSRIEASLKNSAMSIQSIVLYCN